MQEIYNRALQILEQHLAAVLAEEMPPAQRLEAAIDNHVEAFLQHRSIIAVLLRNVELSQDTVARRQRYAVSTLAAQGWLNHRPSESQQWSSG